MSEAVDFARYYAGLARQLERLDGAVARPLGVVAVAGPWNFPLAIPIGGALAALAAGNAAIVKPAPQTPAIAFAAVAACRTAGIPADALLGVLCADGPVGSHLIGHGGLGAIVLTGSFETAELFARLAPRTPLFAETSGKNAMVVMPEADVDQAAADLAHSAFGHAGQKCSAASLAILVGDVAHSTALPPPAGRRRPLPPAGPGDVRHHHPGTAGRAAGREAPPRADLARGRAALAARAAPGRPRALVTRHRRRRGARGLVRPHGVLRPGARADGRPGPRRGAGRCRTRCPTASPVASGRSTPATANAGPTGSRWATPTSTAPSPGPSSAGSPSGAGSARWSARAPRRVGPTTSCSCAGWRTPPGPIGAPNRHRWCGR